MLNIFAGLPERKRRKALQQGDPLAELRKFLAGQSVRQLRLSCQNDLQQLGLRSFEIRKQSNGFKHRQIQVLRLIDDNDDASSSQGFSQQDLSQSVVRAD